MCVCEREREREREIEIERERERDARKLCGLAGSQPLMVGRGRWNGEDIIGVKRISIEVVLENTVIPKGGVWTNKYLSFLK